MLIEQLYTGCLAEAAYFIASEGEAVVVDPLREYEPYLELAQKHGVRIKYVLETHFHADFVSGHVDLAAKTGATIVYGPTAVTGFDSHIAKDGEVLEVGKLRIKVLHTPGHTPESSCFLLYDEEGNEHAIFTGDTLFLGDVGRPDLALVGDITQEDLAGQLFDSIHNKILPLPDDVIVYPGHGAGSACGKNMSSETTGLLGEQKRTNYALRKDMSKEEFIKELTTGILPPPQYFPKNALMNKEGYEPVDQVLEQGTTQVSPEELLGMMENVEGLLILDVRHKKDFVQEHIPGSMFIGLDGTFAMWVGALIEDLNTPIVLVAPDGREEEAALRLSRVGYDNALGYLEGGIKAWKAMGGYTDSLGQVPAAEVLGHPDFQILDVRKPSEWDNGHLEQAENRPLDWIADWMDEMDPEAGYVIHCKSGFRSVVAASILARNGFVKLIDVDGGFDAIASSGVKICGNTCAS